MIYIFKNKSSVCTVCSLHGPRFNMTGKFSNKGTRKAVFHLLFVVTSNDFLLLLQLFV